MEERKKLEKEIEKKKELEKKEPEMEERKKYRRRRINIWKREIMEGDDGEKEIIGIEEERDGRVKEIIEGEGEISVNR